MTELLVPGLIIASVVVAATWIRLASVERRLWTLSRLEAKLDALLTHEGIRFDPYGSVPPDVHEALLRGKKIEAIKAYRVATGAGLQEAKDYVEEMERRSSTRA